MHCGKRYEVPQGVIASSSGNTAVVGFDTGMLFHGGNVAGSVDGGGDL